MKVFISWSGERSKIIAQALRNWLPKVIQASEPWMSQEDISSGVRWSLEIFNELENTKVGIVCITPENQHNPWILFESGALSKSIEHTYVIPYLYDMNPSQISGPLVQFQAVQSQKEGTLKLLLAINKALGEKGLEESELKEVFEVWWYKLEDSLNNVPEYTGEKQKVRPQSEILEEILENTREQLRKEDIRLNNMMEKEDSMIEVVNAFKEQLVLSSQQKNPFIEMLKENEFMSKVFNFKRLEELESEMNSNVNLQNPFEQLSEIMQKEKGVTAKLLELNKNINISDDEENNTVDNNP